MKNRRRATDDIEVEIDKLKRASRRCIVCVTNNEIITAVIETVANVSIDGAIVWLVRCEIPNESTATAKRRAAR